MPRDTLPDKLKRKVGPPDERGCWPWLGYIEQDGYARVMYNYVRYQAHRLIYELITGPVPPGLQLDHLCRNRACVNPDHLDAVTAGENNARSFSPSAKNRRKTHCRHGHEFTEDNTYRTPDGRRQCRQCHQRRQRKYLEGS